MNTSFERKAMKEEWLTPPDLLAKLGEFDLDPCSPVNRPWDTAKKHYTILDDGLRLEWQGRVWMNSPYGNQTNRWLARLAEHGNGIALIFARTETKMFFDCVWGKPTRCFFSRAASASTPWTANVLARRARRACWWPTGKTMPTACASAGLRER